MSSSSSRTKNQKESRNQSATVTVDDREAMGITGYVALLSADFSRLLTFHDIDSTANLDLAPESRWPNSQRTTLKPQVGACVLLSMPQSGRFK